MKTRFLYLPVLCLISISLIMPSCSSKSSTNPNISTTNQVTSSNTLALTSNTTETSAASTSAVTATSMAPKTTSTTSTTASIFDLAQNIPAMKYTMIVTVSGSEATTMMVWEKKDKMRVETSASGSLSVSLVDDGTKTMYAYFPAKNMAYKVDYSQAPKLMGKQISPIAGCNPVMTGTDTVDGILCQIYEYNSSGNLVRIWLWKDKGLPIKLIVTATSGTTTVEYKDYDFSDIPDSMFQLPAGISIVPMPGN